MPSTRTILRVFVASPSDTAEERGVIASAIAEINRNWARHTGVQLEYAGWDNDAVPGIGDYPQDVINESVAGSYDVFVGVLRHRFGTPTPVASSGTEEEFNIAYSRWKADKNSVRVLMYFASLEVRLDEIDPDQFMKLRKFRNELGDQGVLWWSYRNLDDFRTQVTSHLTSIMRNPPCQVMNAPEDGCGKVLDAPEVVTNQEILVEEGFLDLTEQVEERIQKTLVAMSAIQDQSGYLTENFVNKSNELVKAHAQESASSVAKQKKIINEMAAAMSGYADVTEQQADIIGKNFSEAAEILQRILPMALDHPSQTSVEQLDSMYSVIFETKNVIRLSQVSASELAGVIDSMPKPTTNFNIARRKASLSLNKVSEVFFSCFSALEQLEIQIIDVVKELKNRLDQQ